MPEATLSDATTDAIRREQDHLDELHRQLNIELATIRAELAAAADHPPTDPQERVLAGARVDRLTRRRAELEPITAGLCFGRIEVGEGDLRYIGRTGLREADADHPLLIDWRAPVARSFYTATSAAPQGLRSRRHIRTTGRLVVGVDDESLTGAGADDELVGEAALIAALDARRTGTMGDIVATLQREQDEIIRSSPTGCLVVQGGPGTGKTVVALHRAAYLLFTHERLAERGVLVVGPSPAFLRYIDQVLPSLGETRTESATPATLLPGVIGAAAESPATERIKGDARWAVVLRRQVELLTPRTNDLVVAYGDEPLRLPATNVQALLDQARADLTGLHQAREQFRSLALDALTTAAIAAGQQLLIDVEEGFEEILRGVDKALRSERGPGDDPAAPTTDPVAVRAVLAADPAVIGQLDNVWPAVDPRVLLAELLGDETLLAELAPELTSAERTAVWRSASSGWTAADIALLDELAELVGAPGHLGDQNNAAGRDRSRVFGHVIVDEAQELSAMQWRMLLRRCPTKSFTVVGDINQAEAPGAATSWDAVLCPLFGTRLRRVDLTVCYRTPREVMELTVPVLRAAGSTVDPPKGVRSAGREPWTLRVRRAELAGVVASGIAEQLETYRGGSVAVIAPDELVGELRSLEGSMTVLTPMESKGLEFDATIVIDPDGMTRKPRGHNALYVAMTRCTQELGTIVLID